jgi:PTS system nitrogen regulatory IIA component
VGDWLDLAGAARFLGTPEETVTRWVRQGLLPCRGSLPQVRFERATLERWSRERGLRRSASRAADPQLDDQDLLAAAVARGAVGRMPAADAAAAIEAALAQLPDLPDEARSDLLEEVLGRERMASTGLGHGFAIPHPRRPPGRWIDQPTVSVLFLEEPLDWAALDGEPVHTVLLLLSPSVSVHLELLARVSMVLHDETFRSLLTEAPEAERLLALLRHMRRDA